MGFDDLAKHMASRDGKKQPAAALSADQFVAAEAEHMRRAGRKRDLILGTILLAGGAVMLALYLLYILDATNPTPNPNRPPDPGYFVYSNGIVVAAGGAVITGIIKLVRGIRGRS